MLVKLTIFILLMFGCCGAERGTYLGCFQDVLRNTNTSHIYTDSKIVQTIDGCVSECELLFYRYANVKKDQICICSNVIETMEIDKTRCDIDCSGQICGSTDNTLSSVYSTGIKVPGPVRKIGVRNITETTIRIEWMPPDWPPHDIVNYLVEAKAIRTYSHRPLSILSWTLSPTARHNHLYNLQPGSTYQISVRVITKRGSGPAATIEATTLIGEPDPSPNLPTLIERKSQEIIVQLEPAINENGPISKYRIAVVNEDSTMGYELEHLKSYREAEKEGLTFYITAEIEPFNTSMKFTVGDGRKYGGYTNVPLPAQTDVHILLGVVSIDGDITKYRYSPSSHSQHSNGVIVLDVDKYEDKSDPAVIRALSIAIGLLGSLLLLSIVALFVLKYKIQRRRRRTPECQELSLQGPILEVENSGFVPEEELESVNHYENLKKQVWSIPKNFLELRNDIVLGTGDFGMVTAGTVQKEGNKDDVEVYTIPDTEMKPNDEKTMLRSLNDLVIAGKHNGLISMIGLQENAETLFVVLEKRTRSLKTTLLESRNQNRECATNISEADALQMMIQTASAMAYLSHRKIVHKKLCARNVFIDERMMVKVTGHGLTDYYNGFKPDYTRWTAHEIFRLKSHTIKSDVWSFGCLLWEIASIGGTPYNTIANNCVPDEVKKGYKLPRLSTIGHDLYQLMLFCWQSDLSDRPTFEEIGQTLGYLLSDTSIVKFNFDKPIGFTYENYRSDLEFITDVNSR